MEILPNTDEDPWTYGLRLMRHHKILEDLEQARACAVIIQELQEMWNTTPQQPLGKSSRQRVHLFLGSGGSGKTYTYTKVIKTLLLHFLGANAVAEMAPSHAAARLLGLDATTVHKFAEALPDQDWSIQGSEPHEPQKGILGQRLRGIRAVILDEFSMCQPEVFNGAALRHTAATEEETGYGAESYMDHPFGDVEFLIYMGDLLQLRPPMRRSLAEEPGNDYAPKIPGVTKKPSDTLQPGIRHAANQGRRLFQRVQNVHRFNGTRRFLPNDPLIRILQAYRTGSGLSDADWALLQDRTLTSPSQLETDDYANGFCGGFVWEIVGRLIQLKAVRAAKKAGAPIWYVQRIDVAERLANPLTPEDLRECLEHLSLTDTGKLLGLCPLFVGMRGRITTAVFPPYLVQGVSFTIEHIVLHPLEPPPPEPKLPGEPYLLKYMPLGVFVRLDTTPFDTPPLQTRKDETREPWECAEELWNNTDLVFLEPTEATWTWTRQFPAEEIPGVRTKVRRGPVKIRIKSRQLAFAPIGVDTHYGLQGQTAIPTFIGCLEPPAKMLPVRGETAELVFPVDYWLAVYTLLSRAVGIRKMLLTGLPDRAIFSQGPPPELAARMRYFEALGEGTSRRADSLLQEHRISVQMPQKSAEEHGTSTGHSDLPTEASSNSVETSTKRVDPASSSPSLTFPGSTPGTSSSSILCKEPPTKLRRVITHLSGWWCSLLRRRLGHPVTKPPWYNQNESEAITEQGVQAERTCGLHACNHVLGQAGCLVTRRKFEEIGGRTHTAEGDYERDALLRNVNALGYKANLLLAAEHEEAARWADLHNCLQVFRRDDAAPKPVLGFILHTPGHWISLVPPLQSGKMHQDFAATLCDSLYPHPFRLAFHEVADLFGNIGVRHRMIGDSGIGHEEALAQADVWSVYEVPIPAAT